jgi:transcriptional regulator GlxA family with amidase domain
VVFVINPGVQVIDLGGPWETFQDTLAKPDAAASAFELFTVSATLWPFRASGELMVVPDFTIDDAPVPDTVSSCPILISLIPGRTKRRRSTTGSGKRRSRRVDNVDLYRRFPAREDGAARWHTLTTNQKGYDNFARTFPAIDLRRGPRFVEAGRIAMAGSLSVGIDLALRVVDRCFGDGVTQATADTMEYAGTGWRT